MIELAYPWLLLLLPLPLLKRSHVEQRRRLQQQLPLLMSFVCKLMRKQDCFTQV